MSERLSDNAVSSTGKRQKVSWPGSASLPEHMASGPVDPGMDSDLQIIGIDYMQHGSAEALEVPQSTSQALPALEALNQLSTKDLRGLAT